MPLPDPSWTADAIVAHLRSIGTQENRAGMARFGINTATALGVGNSDLRPLARKVKRNHERALALWDSGIREARLMAAFTGEPKKITIEQCRRWAADFDSWESANGPRYCTPLPLPLLRNCRHRRTRRRAGSARTR